MSLSESGQAGGTRQVVVACWAIAAANGTNFLFTRDAVARGSVPTGGCTGPRRTALHLFSAEDAEGRGGLLYTFLPRRTRRGAEDCFAPFFRGGRGGARRTALHLFPWRARRGAENCFTPFFRGGRGGARRTALHLFSAEGAEDTFAPFCPRRTRRGAEDCFTPFFRGGRGELLYTLLSGRFGGILGAGGAFFVWAWGLRMFSDKPFALQFAVAAEVEDQADLEAGGFQIVEELGVFFAGELIERL